jgi:ubiquinone/menaquinone biosynthesis C-methylase UbiE
MTVLDFGCAMGFFSLAMARVVGPSGRVIAVDVQGKMVESLTKRAQNAGLAEIIEPYVCPPDTVGLKGWDGTIDFILAFAVVHEVPDPRRLFGEFSRLLKSGGKLLLAEPKGHVSKEAFEQTLAIACQSGLSPLKNLKIFMSYAVLLQKIPESSTKGKES